MEEIVKVIRVDTKGSAKTINQLKKEIKDLKTQLESTAVGSAEFSAKLKALGQAQQQFANINLDVAARTQSMEQSFKNLAQFGGNLTKSFSSISAMVGLLGGNADDANKALLKVAQTMQLVQGISGFGQAIGQLPKIIAQFKNWADQLLPINKRIGDIASSLNGLDSKTISSLEKIASGNINIQANTASASASASSASSQPIVTGGSGKVYTPANSQPSAAGAGARNYVPKLVEDEEKLLNTQDKLIKQAEVLNNKNEVLQTEYIKVGGRLEALTKFGKEFNEAFTESNKVLGNADAAFDEATKKLMKLGYSAEEIKFNIKELNNGGIAKLSEQAKTLRSTIEENNKTIGNNLQIVDSLTEAYKASGKELGKSGNIIVKAVNGIKTAFKSLGSVVKAAMGAIAVTATIAAIVKLYEVIRKSVQAAVAARKEAKELRLEVEKGTSGAAKQIVVLKELSEAYKKVGDSANEKKKFLEEYADKIKETGLAIVDVNTADDIFINNTSRYIEALKSRAKAQGAEGLAIKKYQEYLEKRAELEEEYRENKLKADTAQSQLDYYIGQGIGDASLGPISDRLDKAQKAAQKAEAKLGELDSSIDKTIDNLFKVVEAENAAADAALKPLEEAAAAAEAANKAEAEAKAAAEKARANAKAEAERNKAQRDKELEELAKYYKAARDLFKDARTKELDDIREKYDAQIELAKKYGKDTTALEQARQREIADVIKKYNDQALKDQEEETNRQLEELQKQIERIRKMNDTSNLRFREQNYQTEYRQSGITSALGLGAAWKNVYQSKDDVDMQLAMQIEYNNKILALTEKRITQENELLKQQLNIEGLNAERREEIERTLEENLMALKDAEAKKDEDNLKAYLDHQKKRQEAMNATLSVASSVFGSIASIAQASMNAQIETEGKTTTEIDKAKKEKIAAANTYATMSIAQATIDTYKSANEAYSAMASIPYVGPVLGAAAAAAAVIAGVANVRQIIQTAQQAKLSASASISTSAGSSTTPPAALNTNPVTYTRNLLGDKETEELNNPIKCYVLESEITSKQTKVAVTESNASF